jgi:hypothetical protein
MQWILVLTLVWFSMPLNAQQSTQEAGDEEIASPKDTSKKKLIKIPPIPKIPKKVLSAADSIAQINHHSSRYIFAPSAYPISKGSFYYQN